MMATGIALGGALAHVLEMPNELGMDQAAYLATQGAYRGWALLAIVLVGDLSQLKKCIAPVGEFC